MNFEIIFSAYINRTKSDSNKKEVERYLVFLAKNNSIEGFSLTEQLGYWAGEIERSYVLTLLNIEKAAAVKAAENIKNHFEQDAVILSPVQKEVTFI